MNNSTQITVIDKPHRFKFKEKGSVFIGIANKITSVEEALNVLENIKKEFYDATHHCYAYKTLNGTEKYSDDGEPNGTAGIRILNAIEHYNLTDIIITVVRYFGGTKLGIGPLGKAYSTTAMKLLEETSFVKLKKYSKLKISYRYEDSSKIHYLLNKYKCKNIQTSFEENPLITCLLEFQLQMNFSDELTEITKGKAQLSVSEKSIYMNFKT